MREKRKRGFENGINWGSKFQLDQNLCNEAIDQILLHSPPSTVARFKVYKYNKSYDRVRFNPVSIEVPEQEQNPIIDVLMGNQSPDNSYCILDSSNGLQLLFFTNFSDRSLGVDPQFIVRNYVSGSLIGIAFAPNVSFPYQIWVKYNVFGFYFDPYCERPNFTIVEITHDGNRVRTCKFNSLVPGVWRRRYHEISSRSFSVLIGSSTFLNGSLHWLAQTSGIVSYNLRTEDLRLYEDIPGDEIGICCCVEKIREASGCYSNGDCSCRFFGEVKDKLVYIRVTGDFVLSMWVLENYYEEKWSHARRIVLGGFPASTPSSFFGKVLGFDRKDPNVMYIRLKRTVYSYNLVKRLANEMFVISKDYGGEDNCLGLIIPYEFPRVPMSIWHIPLMVPRVKINTLVTTRMRATIKCKASYARAGRGRITPKVVPKKPQYSMPPVSSVFGNMVTFYYKCQYVSTSRSDWPGKDGYDDKTLQSLRKSKNGLIILHRHIAISQIASKVYTTLNLVNDLTLPPVWSKVDFRSTKNPRHLQVISLVYSQTVRLESALYGFASERDADDGEVEEDEGPEVID